MSRNTLYNGDEQVNDVQNGVPSFPTKYTGILERLHSIDPLKYARTRNFVHGDVTYLSPYISRGVISLRQVANHVLKAYKPYQIEKFLQELAWREYWQRVWQSAGNQLFSDLKQPQPGVQHHKMLAAIETASTGIEAIDRHLHLLYNTGYMHNHVRMYVSAITCNMGKAHWLQPSRWMYYHLLDGDLASNSLSWQWVAGAFSSKKYYCNQENINRYTNSEQTGSFLDDNYEALTQMPVPEVLRKTTDFLPATVLPITPKPVIQNGLPVLVYNNYNLDPLWHSGEAANRILLLEPEHFAKYPVSEKVVQFIISLTENIQGIQVYTGSFAELQNLAGNNPIHFKTHPAFTYYTGIAESYEYLFPEVKGYYPSFFSYWKKAEKYLKG